MANSFINCLMHVVFSTKNREKLINSELQERLWPYMGGLARERGIKALVIGGTDDHIHMLLSFPSTISIADAVKGKKGISSKWVHDTIPTRSRFAWQEGYGAFSVSASHQQKTIDYIANQKEHHRKKTFKEEYLAFLKKNNIEYNERYVWG